MPPVRDGPCAAPTSSASSTRSMFPSWSSAAIARWFVSTVRRPRPLASHHRTSAGIRAPSPHLPTRRISRQLCAQVIADAAPAGATSRAAIGGSCFEWPPMRAASGELAGAVLTFTNVTAFRASLEQAIYEREYTKAILNTVSNPLVVLDAELRVQIRQPRVLCRRSAPRANRRRAFRSAISATTTGRRPACGRPSRAILSDDSDFEQLEITRGFPALGPRTVLLDARRISRAGDATILSGVPRHHRAQARRERPRQARRHRRVVGRRDYQHRSPWVDHQWNHGAERLFGYTAAEAIGQSVYMLIPEDRLDEEQSILRTRSAAMTASTPSKRCAVAKTARCWTSR